MDIIELEIELNNIIIALQLRSNKISVVKNVSVQFVIAEFGTVICGINRIDYSEVKKVIDTHFDGYRILYVTTNDDLSAKRYEIIWELMTAGYMRWLRFEYTRLFTNLITVENFGIKIITERLKRFNGKVKYKYIIEQNEWAMRNAGTYILSIDPGFYDMMPELGE